MCGCRTATATTSMKSRSGLGVMLRCTARLHVWSTTTQLICLIVLVTSLWLLWLAVNDSADAEGRTAGTVGEVTPSQTKNVRRHRFRRSSDAPTPRRTASLYYDKHTIPQNFQQWSSSAERTCSGRLIGYGHEFVLLKNVVVDRTYCHCQRRGGEQIDAVINQEEFDEYYSVDVGCFQLPCVQFRPYSFSDESKHLNAWMSALKTGRDVASVEAYQFDEFTIAVQRYEYVNLYHTMTDWYNAFLMMQFFGRSPQQTNILIFDSHPYGSLDPVWPQLFNSTFRLSSLPPKTRFRRMVWNIVGYSSPMKIVLSPYPPLLEEFRSFFLSSFDIDADRRVDCENLSVLFIWRRDYVAHPRNPTGFVLRKIRNEAKLIAYVRKKMPEIGVRGVQIDALPMRDQLQLVVNADILVGVHGAGLAHAIFLPRRTGLLELSPNWLWSSNEHFEAIASWRGLTYMRWANSDVMLENESQGMLTVPPHVVTASIRKIRSQMCSKS